jgi:hypothetical protein
MASFETPRPNLLDIPSSKRIRRYKPLWRFLNFKTGALNHSATLPKLECQSLSVRHLRRQCGPGPGPAASHQRRPIAEARGAGRRCPHTQTPRARSRASRTVSLFLFRLARGDLTRTTLRRQPSEARWCGRSRCSSERWRGCRGRSPADAWSVDRAAR